MRKRLISIFLVFSMLIALPANALAIYEVDTDSDETSFFSIPSEDNSSWAFRTEDLPDGNTYVYLLKDGEIVSTSFLDRDLQTITTYDISLSSKETISYAPNEYQNSPLTRASYFPVGAIEYTYGAGTSTRTADISYKYEMSASAYNLTGTYKNMASVISLLIAVFTLPGAIAGKVASSVLSYLGFGVSATSFFIPDFLVTADRHTMTWRAVWRNPGGLPSTVMGYQYIITQPGYSGTHTEGPYYAASAYTNRNVNLAKTLYDGGWWSYDETYGTPYRWLPLNNYK